MIKEVISNPFMSLSQKENINFREERKIVDEEPDCVWERILRIH